MAEQKLSKLTTRVRFFSPAPLESGSYKSGQTISHQFGFGFHQNEDEKHSALSQSLVRIRSLAAVFSPLDAARD